MPWRGEANGWVAVLRKARAAGLSANLELMTTRAERLAELGRPCLPHLDCLIVNDYEIGALAGRETRRPDGSTDPAAVSQAIGDVLALGSMRWAAAHFPEGAIVGTRDGSRSVLGSVALPASAVVGANGAGDAFAAGVLYGLHEQWPMDACLQLGHAMRRGVDACGVDNGRRWNGQRMPGAGEAMGIPAAGARRLSAQSADQLFEGDCLHVPEFPHRLIFVRHGETAYNAENRLQGQLDIPLNPRGREQARAVGGTLRSLVGSEIDQLEADQAFFASPLERARETMEIARDAMGLPPSRYRLDPVLKEISFGAWEGLTWREIEARDPKRRLGAPKRQMEFCPARGRELRDARRASASLA